MLWIKTYNVVIVETLLECVADLHEGLHAHEGLFSK